MKSLVSGLLISLSLTSLAAAQNPQWRIRINPLLAQCDRIAEIKANCAANNQSEPICKRLYELEHICPAKYRLP